MALYPRMDSSWNLKELFMTTQDSQIECRKIIIPEDKKGFEKKRGLSERKYLEMTQYKR